MDKLVKLYSTDTKKTAAEWERKGLMRGFMAAYVVIIIAVLLALLYYAPLVIPIALAVGLPLGAAFIFLLNRSLSFTGNGD